jgi:hypothetical protein
MCEIEDKTKYYTETCELLHFNSIHATDLGKDQEQKLE